MKDNPHIPVKSCGCCNKAYLERPKEAVLRGDLRELSGWYWNCSCGSTMLEKIDQIDPNIEAARDDIKKAKGD